MSEPVVLALIGLLGASSGIVTLVKAILDHRASASSREQDADERLTARLERRLDLVERALDDERAYTALLADALIAAGIAVPARPHVTAGGPA